LVMSFRKAGFDTDAPVMLERIKNRDEFKARFFIGMVYCGEVGKIVETLLMAQISNHGVERIGSSLGKWLAVEGLPLKNGSIKSRLEEAGKPVFPSFRGHNRSRFGILRHDETIRFAQFCVEI